MATPPTSAIRVRAPTPTPYRFAGTFYCRLKCTAPAVRPTDRRKVWKVPQARRGHRARSEFARARETGLEPIFIVFAARPAGTSFPTRERVFQRGLAVTGGRGSSRGDVPVVRRRPWDSSRFETNKKPGPSGTGGERNRRGRITRRLEGGVLSHSRAVLPLCDVSLCTDAYRPRHRSVSQSRPEII